MLNAKFQYHRPTGSAHFFFFFFFAVYSYGCHFGQVTLKIYTNFRSSSMKFGFDQLQRWLNILAICMYIATGQEQKKPWVGTKCFHEHKYSVTLYVYRKFPPI